MLTQQKVSTLLHSLLKNTAVPVLSGPLKGWKWLPPSGNHAYWIGKHERAYVNEFANHIKHGDVVFDIGAQAGYFTLVASRLVGSQGRVVAFEPFPENIDFIKAHCELNDCDNTTLLEVAVGGSCGTRTFQVANAFMGHILEQDLLSTAESVADSVSDSATDSETDSGSVLAVSVVTLDELPASHQNLRPDVMKIDTEGMEYWVLQGGKEMIQAHRPILFIATHGEINQKRTLQLLEEWNYEVVMIGEGSSKNADYIAKPLPGFGCAHPSVL
jgi:FkbM family methyltransferase